MKRTDELLAAPRRIVSREALERFRELLSSKVYHRYAAAHERVEFDARASAFADIRAKGSELLRISKGVLAHRRVSMNLISVVPKMVDAAFGKLPGVMAQFAGDLASKYLSGGKSIVIYELDNWAKEYIQATVDYYRGHRARCDK